jgi:hypothetical protein
MKLSLEPFVVEPGDITAESLAVARWYDSQPVVRRLWAVKQPQRLHVIVAIEPTLDNDDIYPVWLANAGAWTSELSMRTGCPVRLELFRETPFEEIEIGADGAIIADLYWRDATL